MAENYCPSLDITQIERNFAELDPAMSPAEAAVEANRCLYCYDAPCMHACPTHIDVPSFIKKIASGNVTGAARVIFDANPIGATCARVCPVDVLCEGACVEKTLVKKPIEIGRLQRYATDHVIAAGKQLFSRGELNGKRVAVIGAGPAGLSCATYLTRLGYDVTVFDRHEKPGGLDTYGMAEYKSTQETSVAEAEFLGQIGIRFGMNVEIVKEPASEPVIAGGLLQRPFGEIYDQWHAIFVAIGLGATNKLNIPGEGLGGVIDALDFIGQVKTRDWKNIPVGRNVVVIGAGNTAVDAVTQAKRLGAERVTMVYRRTEKEAPAYDYEMELARKDGIEFMWQVSPVEIVGDGHVSALRVVDAAGVVSEIACDQVIKAIGQTKMASFFSEVIGVDVGADAPFHLLAAPQDRRPPRAVLRQADERLRHRHGDEDMRQHLQLLVRQAGRGEEHRQRRQQGQPGGLRCPRDQ